MKRISVFISEQILKALAAESKRTGEHVAVLIRRALEEKYLKKK